VKQRLTNDNLARALHQPLYQRMIAFCQQYTPEFPPETIVSSWLNRLYSNDDNIHILIVLNDTYNIVGHVVITVYEDYGYKVVHCHQAQADKGHTGSIDEFMEYVDKLVTITGAYCSIMTVTKHIKSLEKKYGYKQSRVTMIKMGGSGEDNI